MKTVGYLLITVSFLAGSYFAVRPPAPLPVEGAEANQVAWGWVASMLVLGALGVALARQGAQQESRHEGTLTASVVTLNRSLDRIVENAERLDDEKADLNPYDVGPRIDELFPQHLAEFVEARQSIGHVYGLQAYADVMSEFAAGERYINRVWSASVDGYIDEINQYVPRAREQFTEARRKLLALEESTGS